MHEVAFQSVAVKENQALLLGDYFQGIVENREGNWRIFIWHRDEDREKKSWTVASLTRQELQLHTQQGGFCLRSGQDELLLRLDPFQIEWRDLQTLSLEAHRLTHLRQMNEMLELATGEGNPMMETSDGLPLGSGFTLAYRETPERHYYGLGERTGFLNKKGRVWENWTTDEFHHAPRADPLYQAHPFMLTLSRGKSWGLFLDETWRSLFDLASTEPKRSFVHSDGPTFDFYLIPGPTPARVMANYTQLVGKPFLPPLWALGYHQCRWSYPDEKTIRAIVDRYQHEGIPLEAIWFDIDYMEGYKVFTFSPARFPQPKKLIADLKEAGVKTVVIVDPGVKKETGYPVYESGCKLDVFVKDRRDQELIGEVWPQPAVWPDFTQPRVRKWWGDWHDVYLRAGVDGIWNDMNEPAAFHTKTHTLPLGAKHHNYWHAEVHNLYGSLMSQATYEALHKKNPHKRPFVLTRSGFAGIQKYSWVWTGDNQSCWEHLEMSIPMLLNLSMSAVAFCGADIGGFSEDSDGELLTRWTWLGAFYPFMRNHAGKGSRRQEPWAFGKETTKRVKKAIEFRYQILPYLYTLSYQASQTGMPLLRPLFLEYPDDPNTYDLNYQFLVGKDLLVTTATRPGQQKTLLYLPQGVWENYWTGERHEGPNWIITSTPLESIVIFQRAGTAIPLNFSGKLSHAYWENVLWKVALGEQIASSVYVDAGDGYTPGKMVPLQGSYHNHTLCLEDPSGEMPENAQILLTSAQLAQGNVPCQQRDGNLVVSPAKWPVELELQ